MRRAGLLLGILIVASASATLSAPATEAAEDSYWPQWRGPSANGAAPDGAAPPLEWSEDHNVAWKVAIPGHGSSSPVIWGDLIFVSTAVNTAQTASSPVPQIVPIAATSEQLRRRRGHPGVEAPSEMRQFVVMALNRGDGSVAWQQVADESVPHEGRHATNSYASASPLTDGTHVYAFFGSRGLYCYDMDGNLVWSEDFGDMSTRLGFGEGASPALHGDTLVLVWDHEGSSFIVALDKATGEERWRKRRDEPTTWSTPLIVEREGRAQVITAGTNHTVGYDLESGEEIWEGPGLTRNVIPSPVFGDGVVYLTSGFGGNSLLAIDLAPAIGNIAESGAIEWSLDRDTPYVPSPLLFRGDLYLIKSINAILTSVDAKTGKAHYGPQRLEGLGTIYASPVGANGHVYIIDRDGNTSVLAAGAEFKVVAQNSLNDGFDASPAIVGSEMYLRGRRYLYRISSE